MTDTNKLVGLSRRQFLTNSALAAGAATTVGSFVEACSSTGPATTGPTTITIMDAGGDDNSVSDHWIATFQKENPRIKIKRIDFDKNRLSAMMAAGTPPDIVRTPGGSEITSLAARGLALDLDPYFSQSRLLKAEDLQPVCDLYRWNGTVQGQGPRYGMPHDWSQDAMYWIDTAVFDAARVPYPSQTTPLTFDELLDLGKRLTVREGNKIKVYGLGTNFDYIALLLTMIQQQNQSLYVKGDLSKMDFTQPEMRKIMQWFVSWAQAHVGDSPLDPASDWFGPLFVARRYAMAPAGMWFGGFLAGDPSDARKRAMLIPAPQWGMAKRLSTCYGGTGMWIPKASKHHDEAWKFFEWYMGGPPAEFRAKSGFGLSPLKHLFNLLPNSTSSEQEAYKVQQAELPYFSTLTFTPYANTFAITQAIDTHILPAMRGQVSVDIAVQQINDSVNALLSQGKDLIGGA